MKGMHLKGSSDKEYTSTARHNKELWALGRYLWNFKEEPVLWDFLPPRIRDTYYDHALQLKKRFGVNGVFS